MKKTNLTFSASSLIAVVTLLGLYVLMPPVIGLEPVPPPPRLYLAGLKGNLAENIHLGLGPERRCASRHAGAELKSI